MALTPSFSIATTAIPGSLLLTDTSSGSDGAITDRQILIYLSSGSLFTTIDWPLASNPITISPFTKDYATNFVIQWTNGTNILYTSSQLLASVGFGFQEFYNLSQQIASQPSVVNDKNFMGNYYDLIAEILGAQYAISIGSDISNSENMISLYTQLIQNPNLYF